MTALVRGQVVRADIGLDEPKLLLVVSNHTRNRNFQQVIAVRLTTTAKDSRPSIVELGPQEGFHGRVMCDDLMPVWEDEVLATLGAAPFWESGAALVLRAGLHQTALAGLVMLRLAWLRGLLDEVGERSLTTQVDEPSDL